MKKLLLSLALLAGFVGAKAQDNEGGIRYGVKAGAIVSNLTFSGSGIAVSYGSKVGLTAGGFAKIPLGDGGFSIQPEINYASLGAKSSDFGTSATLALGYIQVPVLAQYEINNSGFHLLLGPQIGVLLSAKSKVDGESEDVKDEFKSTDFSLASGLGYQFRNLPIRLDARSQFSLGTISKESDGFTSRNFGVGLTVGYVF